MQNILSDGKKHEKSRSHLEAYKMWKTYSDTESVYVLFSRARREEVECYNEDVRRNRDMLSIISETVLY